MEKTLTLFYILDDMIDIEIYVIGWMLCTIKKNGTETPSTMVSLNPISLEKSKS